MGQVLPPLAIAEVESSCATCLPSCQPLGGREVVNIPAAAHVTHVIQLLLGQQQLLRQLPTDTCTTIRQWPIPTAEDRAQALAGRMKRRRRLPLVTRTTTTTTTISGMGLGQNHMRPTLTTRQTQDTSSTGRGGSEPRRLTRDPHPGATVPTLIAPCIKHHPGLRPCPRPTQSTSPVRGEATAVGLRVVGLLPEVLRHPLATPRGPRESTDC